MLALLAFGAVVRSRDRQVDRERAARVELAFDRHAAVMRFDDVTHDREPEAAALHIVHEARADAMESFEDLGMLRPWDPDPVVAHPYDDLAVLLRQRDADFARLARVLQR